MTFFGIDLGGSRALVGFRGPVMAAAGYPASEMVATTGEESGSGEVESDEGGNEFLRGN